MQWVTSQHDSNFHHIVCCLCTFDVLLEAERYIIHIVFAACLMWGTNVVIRRMSSSVSRHVIWESQDLVAYLHHMPWTSGSVILERKTQGSLGASIFHLDEHEYLGMLMGARTVGHLLCDKLGACRCALVSRPHEDKPPQIRILPLHGLDEEWRPHLAAEEEHNHCDPGYCTSKNGPRWTDSRLAEVQAQIRAKLPVPDAPPNLTFLGDDPAHPGLFPRIIRGEEQQWRVWDDDGHVAFLTPFPNSPGFTVLVPRRPLTSDILRLEKEDYEGLVLAGLKLARLLEEALGASGIALVFEGFEIDYAHAKLIPLLPRSSSKEKPPPTKPPSTQFYPLYPGYVTSEDGPEVSLESLEELHSKIAQP